MNYIHKELTMDPKMDGRCLPHCRRILCSANVIPHLPLRHVAQQKTPALHKCL